MQWRWGGIHIRYKKGNKLAVLSIGSIAQNVTEAIKSLDVSHYDLRFVKPLDENLLHTIFKTYDTIVSVEDNVIKGGFGSAILEFASTHNYKNNIKTLGIPDTFIEHGKVDELHKLVGLHVMGLSKKINSFL